MTEMNEERAQKTVETYCHFDRLAYDENVHSREDNILMEYREAKGFLAGWNARGHKDCQILDDYPDITVDDLARIKNEILNLQTSDEGGSPK